MGTIRESRPIFSDLLAPTALKHGLEGAAGSAVVRLGAQPNYEHMTVIGEGASIEYLRRADVDGQGTVWQSATTGSTSTKPSLPPSQSRCS